VCAGEDFYGMYDAQSFATRHAPELGMQTVPSLDVVYTEEAGYVTADVVSAAMSEV
jgi:sulfate adenylyltransferase